MSGMLRPLLLALVVAGCSESPMPMDDGGTEMDAGTDAAPLPDAWVWDPDSGCIDSSKTLACPFEATSETPSETPDGAATTTRTTTSARVWLCPGWWTVRRCAPTRTYTSSDGGGSPQATDECEQRASPGGDTLIECSESITYEVNGAFRWSRTTTWATVRVER